MVNTPTKFEQNRNPSVVRLLYLAAWLWLGYLLLFFIIDRLFVRNPPAFGYYALNTLCALLVLGLAWWHQAQVRLGRAFLPLVIILMSAMPILVNHLFATRVVAPGLGLGATPGPNPGGLPLPPGPTTSAEGMALRLLPMLFMALVLTAWQYRWPQVVLYSLGTAGLAIGLIVVPALANGGVPNWVLPGILVAVVQTLCFLTVGYFISTLMSRMRAQQAKLAQANAQLLHYAGTLESLTVSRERNRMARELHDTLAHTLSGLSVQLETVEAYWDVDPKMAHTLLEKSLDATRSGLQETRRALKALRASPLDDLGLSLALRRMAESAVERANIQLELEIPEEAPPLAPDVEQCIYRVAQEAVANVVSHASANTLGVQLSYQGDETRLVVRDDGVGFEEQSKNGSLNGHFGLEGLRERAQEIGGQLTIASQPGRGTTVQLLIGQN